MPRPTKSAVLLALFSVLLHQCRAKQEEAIPVSDVGEGTVCDQDQSVAHICLACSSLSFNLDINLVSCCSSDATYQFCNACVKDQDSCAKLIDEVESFKNYSPSDEDYYDDADAGDYNDLYDGQLRGDPVQGVEDRPRGTRDKRFGTLFMKSPKRYGRLIFGKRIPEKRYGRLYMGSGSYFGKRSSDDFPRYASEQRAAPFDDSFGLDKRFGYLLGSSYKLGKRDDEMTGDEYLPEKRYGQLFMGKSKWYGKRDLDKRYGRLFTSRKGMFGKRFAADDDGSTNMDIAKRFGRLFMGRRRGSLFG